jgi:16S rRNA (guanine527-N7)-methyltransferase
VSPSASGLDALAERYALSPRASARLEALVAAVSSDPHAPTSLRAPAEVVDSHLADSLSALALPFVAEAGRIADLGSGAGFPGLPLAIALPEARVSLVESAVRKCRFLEDLVRSLGLANVEVVHGRAEEWTAGLEGHDLVTARALAPLPTLVEYATPLLAAGGRLVAWKARPERGEEADGAAAARELGMEAADIVRVTPFAGARERRLYVYLKVRSTPNGYPRRAGMARKRPLRASSGEGG